jgi:hypothetical protein
MSIFNLHEIEELIFSCGRSKPFHGTEAQKDDCFIRTA